MDVVLIYFNGLSNCDLQSEPPLPHLEKNLTLYSDFFILHSFDVVSESEILY